MGFPPTALNHLKSRQQTTCSRGRRATPQQECRLPDRLPAGLIWGSQTEAAVFQTAAEQNGCYELNLRAIGRFTRKRCLQEVADCTPAWQALPSDYVLEQPKNIVCDRTHSVSALDDIFMTLNPFRRNRGLFADSGRGNRVQLSAILGCGRISKF
jgi:hypothetical protein